MEKKERIITLTRRSLALGFFALCLLWSPQARAASLYFSPSQGNVAVGQTFAVTVEASSVDQAMNAASGNISFPSSKLRVVSISQADSIINLWIQNPTYSNSAAGGTINFEGALLNPGFMGATGDILQIVFQAIAPGSAPLSFSSGSVLANDGNGTNILTVMQPATVTVAKGSSASSGVVVRPPAPTTGRAAAPSPLFVVSELSNSDLTDPQPIFLWDASSALPGVEKYTLQIGTGTPVDAAPFFIGGDEYQLPVQAPGNAIPLAVHAFDAAGNTIEATTSFSIAPLPTPDVSQYSAELGYLSQTLSAAGTATGNTLTLTLERPGGLLTFSAPVGTDGKWNFVQSAEVPVGFWTESWTLSARSSDSRGALSATSAPVTISVEGLAPFFLLRLLVVFLILVIFMLLAMAIYRAVHEFKKWHIRSKKVLTAATREKVLEDLKRLEAELESEKTE